MSDFKNFRITLQLSHFFQDHRSMCKIFVNNKMQLISDLQNHVRDIFNIKNFYFLSNGHYIPPSEDVRILQLDDNVVVLPYHNINPPICTSTPVTRESPVKGKRKRHIIENEKDEEISQLIQENLVDNGKVKKKKKKKAKHEVCTNENCQQLDSGNQLEEDICRNMEQNDTAKRKKQMKPQNIFPQFGNQNSKNTKENINISVKEKVSYFEGQSNSAELKSISEPHQSANKIDTTTEKELIGEDESQDQGSTTDHFRKKKLFVQKRNDDIISYDLPKKSNIIQSILVSQNSVNEKASTMTRTTKNADTNCLNSTSNINYNIPAPTLVQEKIKHSTVSSERKSPVVTNIAFANTNGISFDLLKFSKSTYNDFGIMDVTSIVKDSVNDRVNIPASNFFSPSKSNFSNMDVTSLVTDYTCENAKKSIKLSSNVIENDLDNVDTTFVETDFEKEDVKKPNASTKVDVMCEFMNMDVTSSVNEKGNEPKNSLRNTESNFCNMYETSLPTDYKCGNTKKLIGYSSELAENNFADMDSTSLVRDSGKEEKLVKPSIKFNFNGETITMNVSSFDKILGSKPTQNDSAISLEDNLCQLTTPGDTVAMCSEMDQSLLSESIGTAPSENAQSVEPMSFITKRKRKRTHRKRKTRSSTETAILTLNEPIEYAKKNIEISVQPRIHIKFDDDSEPVADNENAFNTCDLTKQIHSCDVTQTKNSIEKKTDNIMIADDYSFVLKTDAEKGFDVVITKRPPQTEDLNEVQDDMCITILDESFDNVNRKSYKSGRPVISEEIISKSPLMVSTKPKSRDIVAFKILRLTENYTPEVSKYIIGEILNANDKSDVELKIIEGLDQCIDPNGKFSVESVDLVQEEQSNIKTFSWSDLIEPRLIFP